MGESCCIPYVAAKTYDMLFMQVRGVGVYPRLLSFGCKGGPLVHLFGGGALGRILESLLARPSRPPGTRLRPGIPKLMQPRSCFSRAVRGLPNIISRGPQELFSRGQPFSFGASSACDADVQRSVYHLIPFSRPVHGPGKFATAGKGSFFTFAGVHLFCAGLRLRGVLQEWTPKSRHCAQAPFVQLSLHRTPARPS